MNRLLLPLAIASALASCTTSDSINPVESEKVSSESIVKIDAPQVVKLDSGIDLTAIDSSVRPQDDFFSHVNGNWIKNTEMPADKARWGSFDMLRDQSTEHVKAIIVESANNTHDPDTQKIGALYNSFMNEQLIETLGINAIQGELDKIDKISNRDDLSSYFAYADAVGYDAPFGVFVSQDAKNVETYITHFWQSGLGMPDRDYYFDDSEKGSKIQEAYRLYLTKLQKLAGLDSPKAGAQKVYQLEKTLAEHHWTRVENRDAEKRYNKKSLTELTELMPTINWNQFLTAAQLQDVSNVIVAQPNYLQAVNKIIVETDLNTWRRYLKIKLLTAMAPYMHQELASAHFDFYSTTIRGIQEQEPRWKRGVQFTNDSVGELVGKRYVEKHFSPQAKARMLTLVNNLKAAYRKSIQSLSWMSEETKQQALTKLANFSTKIGYPDKWRSYDGLKVQTNNLTGNVLAAHSFATSYNRAKLGQPVDRGEWFMSPQTVNAYYNPPKNEIVFPAAILQPPFFNENADDAVNYGAIGGVIGHEIGHGFDDQGSRYDGEGYLNNWWTDSDRNNFKQLTNKLVARYSSFEPLEGEHINGELTLGENIGDLSGLGIAYKAYKMSLNGKQAPIIDGYTGDQRLFMGWAQVWRGKIRDKALSNQIKTDPHSPTKYRVQGVLPNLSAFYDAFGIKEGDAMYLPEEQRVVIW
ncbi:MAG: peptidase M13 [Gammaproteobacteria bacterium]|nr:peptidase M13 [Gammaproteobacteria bacterium]